MDHQRTSKIKGLEVAEKRRKCTLLQNEKSMNVFLLYVMYNLIRAIYRVVDQRLCKLFVTNFIKNILGKSSDFFVAKEQGAISGGAH